MAKTVRVVARLALLATEQKLLAHGRISISCQFVNYTAIIFRERCNVTPTLNSIKIGNGFLKS